MVTVNIIEGVDNRSAAYEDMKNRLLNQELFTAKEIREKHGIGHYTVQKLTNELKEELKVSFPRALTLHRTLMARKGTRRVLQSEKPRKKKKECKQYTFNKRLGKYQVYKKQNGKRVHFGVYNTVEDAEAVVKELEKADWDKNQLDSIIEKLGIESRRVVKNYYFLNGRYAVRKMIDGDLLCFGYYDTEETAKKIAVEMKKANWDKSRLDEIRVKVME